MRSEEHYNACERASSLLRWGSEDTLIDRHDARALLDESALLPRRAPRPLSDDARREEELAAFERVVALTGCDPAATVMFEDSLKNLVTAKSLGMRTVLVGGATLAEEGGQVGSTVDAHVSVCGLDAVRAALPQLWPQA